MVLNWDPPNLYLSSENMALFTITELFTEVFVFYMDDPLMTLVA